MTRRFMSGLITIVLSLTKNSRYPKCGNSTSFQTELLRSKNRWNLIPEDALSCLALRFANAQLQLDLLNAAWKADTSEIDLTGGQGVETLTFRTIIAEKLQVAKQFTFTPRYLFC